jgi:serine/threonine protein kinase
MYKAKVSTEDLKNYAKSKDMKNGNIGHRHIMRHTFDILQRTITFNPNIRITPIWKLCHNKQNRNSAILGISMEELRRTRTKFIEDFYRTVLSASSVYSLHC